MRLPYVVEMYPGLLEQCFNAWKNLALHEHPFWMYFTDTPSTLHLSVFIAQFCQTLTHGFSAKWCSSVAERSLDKHAAVGSTPTLVRLVFMVKRKIGETSCSKTWRTRAQSNWQLLFKNPLLKNNGWFKVHYHIIMDCSHNSVTSQVYTNVWVSWDGVNWLAARRNHCTYTFIIDTWSNLAEKRVYRFCLRIPLIRLGQQFCIS